MAITTKKFSEFANGGDITNNKITVGLDGLQNAQFNNPWTFLKPGSTGERPVPAPEIYFRLRLNTTLEVYEYYDPTTLTWTQLSGTGTGTVNPGVTNDLAFYAVNGQIISPINGANSSVLVTSPAGVPSLSTTLPSGLTIPGATITGSTAALTAGSVSSIPSNNDDLTNKIYVDSAVGSTVLSITGTANQVNASAPTGNVTLSLPQDIAVGSTPTFLGLTLSSIPLGISSGGTNRSTLPTTPVANNYSAWDANSNIYANNFLGGFATTVSAGGTTILTVASAYNQEITGASTQTVQMPVASTLSVGHSFKIINNSSGNVTLTSSGGNTILVMAANTTAFITCVLSSGTTAASWNASYIFDNGAGVLSITGTANQVNASASTGVVTLSLPQDIAPTSVPSFVNVNQGYTTTVTAAGNTILTATSNRQQYFTGTSTQTVTMPVTSTLVLGQSWVIANNSTGNLTVNSSGGNLIATLSPNTQLIITCILTSGTTASSWSTNGSDFLKTIAVQVFTASGTYTPSPGMKYCKIEVVGGGGAGGGTPTAAASAAGAGGGGGAGEYAVGLFTAAIIGASKAVTIGAGGTGSAGAGGNNGSASGIGGIITASGGLGGSPSGSTTVTNGISGGGVSSGGIGGDYHAPGSSGGSSAIYPAANVAISGQGGASYFGGAAQSVRTVSSVSGGSAAGANSGSGGSGSAIANVVGVAAAGGNGGSGIVVITEYAA